MFYPYPIKNASRIKNAGIDIDPVYVEIGEIVTENSDEGDGDDISSETENMCHAQEKEDLNNKFITKSNDCNQDVSDQTIVINKHFEKINNMNNIFAIKSSVANTNHNLVYGRMVAKEVAKYNPSSPVIIRKSDILVATQF